MTLAELSAETKLKGQFLIISLSICLRVIIDKESLDHTARREAVHKLFELLSNVTSKHKSIKIDSRIVSSVAVLNFENDEVIQHQIEKFIQRVLYTKYEYEQSQKAGEEDKGVEWTKISLNNFIQFFNQLSSKNQDFFKQQLKETHEVKSVKKAGQVSQDLAQI